MYRILVVDDESSACEALALGLASEEFTVDVAADGNCGVSIGCGKEFDVLIVDLCLPDMGGIEVIRRLKARNPEIIPIVITAHYTEGTFVEARQNGATDYFEMPFDMRLMRDAIRRGLKERGPKQG